MAAREGEATQVAIVINPDGTMSLPQEQLKVTKEPRDPRDGWAKPKGWLKQTSEGGGRDVERTSAGHSADKFD